ncbi:Wall-associated receptor kinase 10 [Spatholobus suberectus]|nr:Wall-associated receptor kinase 10 [Spatholobus suberectus]
MVLKLVYIINLMIWSIYPLTYARHQNQTIAQPGCKSECGSVSIPYPFGMEGSKCYANVWFEIKCNSTSQGEKPYLKSIDLEVIFIDIFNSRVWIKNPIFGTGKNCERIGTGINLRRGPFVYSQDYNSFVAVGCQNAAFLWSDGSEVSGCVSICDGKQQENVNNIKLARCRGMHCCGTLLPSYLSEYNVTTENLNNVKKVMEGCAYALIVADDNNQFPFSHDKYNYTIGDLKHLNDVPAVLEWEILNDMLINNSVLKNSILGLGDLGADDEYYVRRHCDVSDVTSPPSQHGHSGWRCTCEYGFQGNPYIEEGCKGPDKKSRAKWAILGVSSSLGTIILLFGLWWLHKVVRKKIAKKRKEKFFKQNGGLLLEQRLSSDEVSVDSIKLFSLKDLEKATDHFNINRVLGKGGQGTVYKGMLADGKIVAVKKLKVNGKVEEFINEFVILSQINHRNVVKLLGCCLETKIPLLVYEFIPNGNLFEYLHGQNDDLPMTWNIRLRIATEVAGALFYLHAAASQPIYHRDIKATNILLDGKYKAKVADFGASRMVSVEATHLTTAVQGTFGYLDPEYFHTSQFTEKSDVYSYGVVLAELLTGQKPISSVKHQEPQSLASYFVLCMEENRLSDIVDEKVMKEGKKEHIVVVANLARRCLELNERKRPTMKEVTLELESIQKLEKQSNAQEYHEEIELAGIEDCQCWAAYSTTSKSGQTSDSKASTLEIMPIQQ